VIETRTVAAVLRAADAGVKGADVALLEVLLADGLGGKAYLLFGGTVSEVEVAVELGVASLPDSSQLVATEVIAQLDSGMWANLIDHGSFGRRVRSDGEGA
jgi:microcompartment protein CcmL/EutN